MHKKNILITGSTGLVGTALRNAGGRHAYTRWEIEGSTKLDLTIARTVEDAFLTCQPDYVIHTAAKVGGVGGNAAHHGEYLYDNVLMNSYMIHYAMKHKVKKFIGFSSVCAFPEDVQVLTEDNIHDGKPPEVNFAYAHAKRLMDTQIRAYKSQYDIRNYCSLISTNIFGKNDWYNPAFGHVLPSLIHKLYLAKITNTTFEVWGDGSAKREFIYADDLANVVYALLELDELPERLIVSSKRQYTIREMVDKLVTVSGFSGNVNFDTSKPNGQHARPTNTTLLHKLLPNMEYTDIDVALKASWDWFALNYPNVRM